MRRKVYLYLLWVSGLKCNAVTVRLDIEIVVQRNVQISLVSSLLLFTST